jgi:hypothetical protein
MTRYDVFNGDADGICALLQLRLATPADAVLVTGAKRDIALLDRIAGEPGDIATVLDISLAVNRDALLRLLERGVAVHYFDHHFAGEVPVHPLLDAHLDFDPSVCTGILVDRHLAGRQRVWAVVAAFGDNLIAAAHDLVAPLALSEQEVVALRDLADCLTYNAYGDSVDDAIVEPGQLFGTLLRHADPFRFIATDSAYTAIDTARRRDLALARQARATRTMPGARVYILPDAAWSRRVRGIFGNELANAEPALAHALLTPDGRNGYAVSVRAPRANPTGADMLCRQFPSGGGRAAAAGIEHLPSARLDEFLQRLNRSFG